MRSGEPGSTWSRYDWVAVAGITAVAGLLRFIRIGEPDALVFDEAHYVQDACRYVLGAADACIKWVRPIEEAHPPLGKWLIAAGIKALGYTSLGWRIAPAVAGTLTVLLLYLVGRRLLRSTAAAALASSLLAIDPLHFVHSRLGTLDIFLPLFATAALLCGLYDRDHILRREASPSGSSVWHPWRFAAGAAAGAAAAVKWPGAFILPVIVFLVFGWELSTRAAAGRAAAVRRTLREEGLSMAVTLLIVPVLVYAASYAWTHPPALLSGDFWAGFVRYHVFLVNYHARFGGSHVAQSPPWMWLVPARPLGYFHEYAQFGCREVAAFASPLWLLALVPIGLAVIDAVRRRRIDDHDAVIIAGFALSYLPWLLAVRNRAVIFIFYMLPVVPFFCLALAHFAGRMRKAVAAWALLSVAFFAFYYPRMAATAHLERLPVHGRACADSAVSPP
jgi:dolichyl-phosphate-mannose--protein O-mannosyl transferase